MTTDERVSLIKQVGQEIISEEELRKLLESGEELIAYDGFEPSGQMHIAQGILRAINVNKMIKAGVQFKMLVADWHAMANNKMGGNLEQIKTVGEYFIEVWRICGMDLDHVQFVWASELVNDPDYWKLVIQIGRTNVLRRFIRTAEMMGREESLDSLTGANIIYSCMQVADVFMLNAKITQLGLDQRKLNMLAREVGVQLGYWKPVVISHHMLQGLGKPPETKDTKKRAIDLKMSKSNPDSAIFMTDTTEEIQNKINKAWCPEGVIEENPILEYCKYILFESLEKLEIDGITIDRPEQFGGSVSYKTFEDLEKDFAAKKLHPQDLKKSVSQYIDKLLQPVRSHFENNSNAKELLENVRSFKVTR
ncbi:tyrosine--tRNA ligase [Candidatus Roizmanbacteria bacterium RIFCSPLOWO2_01_FULL_37_57]|nr:MAG: tyrosine--tRNA ligase [Candidatus Roizmanbacteria bacterium RIFCSPLOWO2_01_FULL_37_57]